MTHLNDNIFQNINKFSVKIYDEDVKIHKHELKNEKKEALITEVIAEHKGNIEAENKEFNTAIDKILIAHRNTKFFLFLMSW